MKIPTLLIRKKKKLRASTARRSLAVADEMDYEEMSEPNMKLSRALLIVLVLHVVAVAGIIAFNTIKSRQGNAPYSSASPSSAKVDPVPAAPQKVESNVANSSTTQSNSVRREDVRPALPIAKEERNATPTKASSATTASTDGGKTYIVVKGDNPVSIAKKHKVSESDLLAINHIDDPRKLKIGQKLIIPAAKKTKAKSDGN